MSGWSTDFEHRVETARQEMAAEKERQRAHAAERTATSKRIAQQHVRDAAGAVELQKLASLVAKRLDRASLRRVGLIHGTPGEPDSFSVGLVLARARTWPTPVADNIYLATNGRLFFSWAHRDRLGFRRWIDLTAVTSRHQDIRDGLARLVARYGR